LLSRLARELPVDSTVVLIVLIAALATGAGGMLVAANNADRPAASPAATPTSDAIGGLGGPLTTPGQGNPKPTSAPTELTDPDATATPEPTSAPTPTAEPQPTSAPPEALTGYVWPLVNARISSPFGARTDGFILLDGKPAHDGLDLATWCGDRIRAAHAGTVLYAGRKFDPYLGYSQPLGDFYSHISNLNSLPIVIVIDDGNGYRSMYVHLAFAKVGAGDVVKAGQLIGYEGQTGNATGCHLHYGLIRMDGAWQAVNPALVGLYPPSVRERVDPLLVLPLRDPDAATRFLRLYPQPSTPGLPFDPPGLPPGD
jgi:murein DD-endopeptidase MepM/ murein hydrolase activator NlpD